MAVTLLFLFAEVLLAGAVKFEQKLIRQARGEAGPAAVVEFTVGDAVYRSLDTPEWKWTTDAMGFDAAALGPGSGTAIIGVRVERLNDADGKVIGHMGPAARATLRKKWDAEVASGSVTILSWEGAPEAEEVIVRYRRVEEGRDLEGYERGFFGEGQFITLGMLADPRQLGPVQSMFARFNGSFVKVER
jgi:hypothetical protein